MATGPLPPDDRIAKRVRVHWLQHVVHETLGAIEPWLRRRRCRVTRTRLYAGEPVPRAEGIDGLVVMGGPMNIYQHRRHPWLRAEKSLINDAIVNNIPVLGICLGAQLIADVLGARITRNRHKEIGLFDVYLADDGHSSPLIEGLPPRFQALHWHGDTFTLPPGAVHLHKSDACVIQSFSWGSRVLGLQYHLECTPADLRRWLQVETPKPARYVQSASTMLAKPGALAGGTRLLHRLLDNLLPPVPARPRRH